MIDEFQYEVTLDLDEVMAAIESLHESIGMRLHYLLDPEWSEFRDKLNFGVFQLHVGWITNAYVKLLMSFRSKTPVKLPETKRWLISVDIGSSVWRILDQVLLAQDWNEFPHHISEHPTDICELCDLWSRTD